LIKAQQADELGNLTYRLAARNFNPIMAMAAKTTIAEVEEIVPVGTINPEHVMTPAIFVHRIVQAKGLRYAGNGIHEKVMLGNVRLPAKSRLTREQIAQCAALELPDGAYVNLGWEFPISSQTICPKRSPFISTAKMEF